MSGLPTCCCDSLYYQVAAVMRMVSGVAKGPLDVVNHKWLLDTALLGLGTGGHLACLRLPPLQHLYHHPLAALLHAGMLLLAALRFLHMMLIFRFFFTLCAQQGGRLLKDR
jgi:hypothetical protein